MIVDAQDHILGRFASYVAKQAISGREVIVVNAEKARVSGKKEEIQKRYLKRVQRQNPGNYRKGPYHMKRPDRFVRKAIRGMLPMRKTRGREAYRRVMVYIGVPSEEIKKNHGIDPGKEKIEELKDLRKEVESYLTVSEICKTIGGKW